MHFALNTLIVVLFSYLMCLNLKLLNLPTYVYLFDVNIFSYHPVFNRLSTVTTTNVRHQNMPSHFTSVDNIIFTLSSANFKKLGTCDLKINIWKVTPIYFRFFVAWPLYDVTYTHIWHKQNRFLSFPSQ